MNVLATAQQRVDALTTRRHNPLSSLEATFEVVESMDEKEAAAALSELIARRYLDRAAADLAQMLAQKLGVPVQWSHMRLVPSAEWQEGRGHA